MVGLARRSRRRTPPPPAVAPRGPGDTPGPRPPRVPPPRAAPARPGPGQTAPGQSLTRRRRRAPGPRRGRSGGSPETPAGGTPGTDAAPRDGGTRSGRARSPGGGAGAARGRDPPAARGRARGGGGGHQRGLRGGPAALLAPGPQERSPPLPAVPGRLLPASARRLPAGAGAGALPAPRRPARAPALHHLRRATEHGAIARRPRAAPAQGLHGGVGAGDHLLLPPDRRHRPRLLLRDPGCDRPRGHGPGKRVIQKGPVTGALQPPLRVVCLHQLGHLCPGGPVPMTGTPSPRDTVPGAPGGSPRPGGHGQAAAPVWHHQGCCGKQVTTPRSVPGAEGQHPSFLAG